MEPLSASARGRAPGTAVQYLGAAPAGDRARRRDQAARAESLCHRVAGPQLAAADQGVDSGFADRRIPEVVLDVGTRPGAPVRRRRRGRRCHPQWHERRLGLTANPRLPPCVLGSRINADFTFDELRRRQEQPARQGGRHSGRRQSRQGLQPAVHLRRRRPRQDPLDACRREQAEGAQFRGTAGLRAQRAIRRRHGEGSCSTTPSTISRPPIARSMR